MTNLVEFPAGGALTERVAEEVRALMARRRVTQAQLGAVLHMSQVSVSERLHGKTPWTLRDIETLARHFDISPAVLLGVGGGSPTFDPGPGGVTGRYPLTVAA